MRQYSRNSNDRFIVWWESKGNWVIIDTTIPDKDSPSGYFVVKRFTNRYNARSYYLQMGDGEEDER